MDKSNVIVYAEGLAKDKNLSDKQKDELIETLKEATSVLNGDQKRIEEALAFLDDKIQNSYKQFFTDTGIVATEIKSTTMIKVEEIVKEVEQIKIAQERADRQAANPNEMINSYIDKAMNMEVKEADLFNLPEKEVRASIKGSLESYFKDLDLPNEFLDKLSKDMYDAKKIELEIEAKVKAGEKREDVEAKLLPDEESRLKHAADLEIYAETAEEEYMQNVEEIGVISAEYGIDFISAEERFFENKPDTSRYKYMLERKKYRTQVAELEETESIDGVKGVEESESDDHKIHAISGFGKKFDGCTKYITEQQRQLRFLEKYLESARKEGNLRAVARYEDACKVCRSNIESYQKMLARLKEKSKKREAVIREDFEFYKENKGEIERLMREENLTVEAAASKIFGHDFKKYGRYIRVNATISEIEARKQKENSLREAKSNNITGKNANPAENGGQTRGTSQLVVEEIQTGGEMKKNKPLELFRGLFKKERTIQAGVKNAYDDLATAQTVAKSQETAQTHQTSRTQDEQNPKQDDNKGQEESVL